MGALHPAPTTAFKVKQSKKIRVNYSETHKRYFLHSLFRERKVMRLSTSRNTHTKVNKEVDLFVEALQSMNCEI